MKRAEELQRDVLKELAWDPSVDASRVTVAASGEGVITLEGQVPTFWQKRAVEGAVKRVAGVKGVANDLAVRLIAEHRRDDTVLAEAAVRALEWHSSVPHEAVKVTVSDGWITLEGRVPWEYQRRSALEAIRDLVGVRGVSDLIEIEAPAEEGAAAPPSETAPEDVEALTKIEAALERSAAVDADRVTVEVEGSAVVLSGTVPTLRAREEAEWVAWSAPGVTSVENRLDVEEGGL